MKRNSLLALLNAYKPEDGIEKEMYLDTIAFQTNVVEYG